MIIVESAPTKQSFKIPKPLIYTSLLTLTVLVATPAILALAQSSTPTGTYLNPLPENELAQVTPTPTPEKRPEELILTAQAYLEKAITLSQKDPQTDQDKQAIITHLNSSLDLANQAIIAAPNSPESYLIRARVLASSTSIRTDATQLAQKDLETAQLLSGGQSVSLPTQVNLINYEPTQQAALASNLIIASPEESQTSTASASTNSNITKQTATIPAGKLSTTITDPSINTQSYIYLIPSSKAQPPFVQAKGDGVATIALTDLANQDVTFEYWIVNP